MTYLSTKWKTICLQCIAYEHDDRKPIEEILQAIRQLPYIFVILELSTYQPLIVILVQLFNALF